jgi:hypothetical protein
MLKDVPIDRYMDAPARARPRVGTAGGETPPGVRRQDAQDRRGGPIRAGLVPVAGLPVRTRQRATYGSTRLILDPKRMDFVVKTDIFSRFRVETGILRWISS